jgi:hypothetical protein
MFKRILFVSSIVLVITTVACKPTAENMAKAAVLIKDGADGRCLKEPKIQTPDQQKACIDGANFLADIYTENVQKLSTIELFTHANDYISQARQQAKQRCQQSEPVNLQIACQIGNQVAWEEILQLSAASNTSSR